ncbi:MAG: transglutaminase domain-containing protein, partial [Chloroflexota bacterium]
QTFVLIIALINCLSEKTTFDPAGFVLASNDLTQRFLAISSRLFLWVSGLWQGTYVEDPLIRVFMWSLAVWLIAAWAGWQIFKNKRLLVGLVPATIAIALVLDYTGKQSWILWVHISLLLFLYGLNGFAMHRKRWEISRVDYSDSTLLETLLMVGALTFGLVTFAFFTSSVSVKDILDDLRERRASSNEARTESLGLQPGGNSPGGSAPGSGLSRSYMIGPGPDLSDDLVMTVSTGELPYMPLTEHPAAPNYYWRTVTYERYVGVGWSNPTPFAEDVAPEQALFEPPYENYRLVHQEITFADRTDQNLYWTGTLIKANVPFQSLWIRKAAENPLLESDMLAALAPVETYRVDSLVLNVSADDLRASPGVYPDWVRNRFLGLPNSVPHRVQALGRDLSAPGKTPFDRAILIQDYLRTFPYSLDVPGPAIGRDATDFFLFDLKKGYCDYYATAMAVLARAAGLPARIVRGYASGSYDSEQARYLVVEKNAHAWVEIYFTGIGWVEFEPTASQPIIAYTETGGSQVSIQPLEPQESSTSPLVLLLDRVLGFAWMPVIGIVLLLLIWIGWDALRFARLGPSQSIQLLYQRLRRLARPVSGSVSMDQTAHEYASLLETRITSLQTTRRLHDWLSAAMYEITQLTELYTRSLFASQSPGQAEIRRAIKSWPRLQWRLLCADVMLIVQRGLQFILRKRA